MLSYDIWDSRRCKWRTILQWKIMTYPSNKQLSFTRNLQIFFAKWITQIKVCHNNHKHPLSCTCPTRSIRDDCFRSKEGWIFFSNVIVSETCPQRGKYELSTSTTRFLHVNYTVLFSREMFFSALRSSINEQIQYRVLKVQCQQHRFSFWHAYLAVTLSSLFLH